MVTSDRTGRCYGADWPLCGGTPNKKRSRGFWSAAWWIPVTSALVRRWISAASGYASRSVFRERIYNRGRKSCGQLRISTCVYGRKKVSHAATVSSRQPPCPSVQNNSTAWGPLRETICFPRVFHILHNSTQTHFLQPDQNQQSKFLLHVHLPDISTAWGRLIITKQSKARYRYFINT
jgi:hypothetical protein